MGVARKQVSGYQEFVTVSPLLEMIPNDIAPLPSVKEEFGNLEPCIPHKVLLMNRQLELTTLAKRKALK